QFEVGAVVPVRHEREAIRRLDPQQEGARSSPGLAHPVARLDALPFQKICDEVADEIIAYGAEERGTQAEAAGTDGDVGRAPADVSGEALDLREGHAHLVRVEVNRAAPHRQQVELALHPGPLLLSLRGARLVER